MSYLRPIYTEGGRRYNIDTCLPQKRAQAEGKIKIHGLTRGHYIGTKLPTTLLPGLSALGFWDAVGSQDWGLEPHRNEGIEISLLETGAMLFTVDGRQHTLKAGDFTVTRPWQLHCLGNPNIGPGRHHWVIIDVGVRHPNQEWKWPSWVMLTRSDLQELTHKLRRNEAPAWKNTPEVTHAFQSLANCVKQFNVRLDISRLIVGLNYLLLSVLDALRLQNRQEDSILTSRSRTVELFLNDLASNPQIMGETWSLSSMASRCDMGRTAFDEYCRMITNTSPMDYLKRCRLDWASRQLVQEPGASVIDVAFACGFSSSQYFATQFKQRYSLTPVNYRKKHLLQGQNNQNRRPCLEFTVDQSWTKASL